MQREVGNDDIKQKEEYKTKANYIRIRVRTPLSYYAALESTYAY